MVVAYQGEEACPPPVGPRGLPRGGSYPPLLVQDNYMGGVPSSPLLVLENYMVVDY